MTEETKKEYVLVAGKYFDENGITVEHGTEVLLTKDQAKAFAGLFEPAEVYESRMHTEDLEKEEGTPTKVTPAKPAEPAKPAKP